MSSEECMTTRALVRAIFADGTVEVAFPPAPRCRGCEGSCTWFHRPIETPIRVRVPVALEVGQAVWISLPARYILLGAVLLHGLPWTMLLLGALAGALLGDSDLSCLGGALLGLAGATVVASGWQRKLESRTSDRLQVILRP